MKVNQIYSLLNDINHQMFGEDAVQVKDLSGIISMGKSVMQSTDNMDLFLGKLVDRIGKTVIRTLDLELDFPGLYMDSYEFGAVLQKITVNPFDAIQASEYQVGENGFEPTLLDIHKADIVVTYFENSTAWKFQRTIPGTLFETAFTNEGTMGQFIDAIINAMTDSMTLAINNMSRTAVNNLIAEKILAGHNVINLVDEYNAAYGLTGDNALSAAECLVTKEFYRFSSTVIRKYIKYLSQPSVLYNEGNNILRATARDNMHIMFLSDLAAGFDAYLLSDSFKDIYGLPYYNEVPYWQGNSDGSTINSFATNSSINIVPSSQESVAVAGNRYAINQSGIVAVLADRQAVAVGLNKRRAGSFYNSIDDYSNISSTAMIQWLNDTSENCVVICIADSIATPAISLDKSTLTFASSAADDQTITATTMPEDATVTWKSSKNSVATVAAGVVSAAGAGSCTITAEITVGGVKYTATAEVTVGS